MTKKLITIEYSPTVQKALSLPARSIGVCSFVVLSLLVGCSGTSGRRPVLYPNTHFESVGTTTAEQDVDICMRSAADFGAKSDSRDRITGDTAKGALVGGAAAGAWGAVRGDAGERALAGAAAGGAAGLVRGVLRSDKPSATYQKFVARCLRDRGYEVIGWQGE